MSTVTTHILDTSRGTPAPGVNVTLTVLGKGDMWTRIGTATTDVDGRIKSFLQPGKSLEIGTYRLRFDTHAYHAAQGVQGFFPHVDVIFSIREVGRHHHVPLLLSPFAYSTYRGS
jgi:5-hydroxyisourate hydrolase